jgi:large subunit ribosomal protein L21
MYAVIETGGKQYKVAPGDSIRVEKLPGDVGNSVELGRVLAYVEDGGPVLTGADAEGVKVMGEIVEQGRGDKLIVFKFKRKKQYKRTIGHRQAFTRLKVTEVVK